MVQLTLIALLAATATALVEKGTYVDKLDDAPVALREALSKMGPDSCNPPHASHMGVYNACKKPLTVRRSDGYVTKIGVLKPGESFKERMRMDQRTPLISYIGSENKKGYDSKITEKVGSYSYSLTRKSLDVHGHMYHIMGDDNEGEAKSILAAASAAICSDRSAYAWAAVGEQAQGSIRCAGKDNYIAASAIAMAQVFCGTKDDVEFEGGVLKLKGEAVNINLEGDEDSY